MNKLKAKVGKRTAEVDEVKNSIKEERPKVTAKVYKLKQKINDKAVTEDKGDNTYRKLQTLENYRRQDIDLRSSAGKNTSDADQNGSKTKCTVEKDRGKGLSSSTVLMSRIRVQMIKCLIW